tara:strand:+ start:1834 stop:2127 length:294 start_codon:yes stop_codon:yes gene_type:complete
MEKKYINGFIIKEKVFDNGGKLLKVSAKIDDLIKELEELKFKSGSDWANLIIARRKEPSEKGVTHYVYEDQWKPEKDFNETNDPQYDESIKKEDLPF